MGPPSDLPLPPSIYFGGCAFGAAFYIGVYQAMVERWGPDFYKKVLLSGGSVGCMFAIAIGLGMPPDELKRMYQSVAQKSIRHGSMHFASVFMEECVRDILHHPFAFKLLEGRLCLGTTYFFSRHRWHVSWIDNEDLVQCVRRSCHIPFYCQRNDGLRGELVVDGAYGFAGTDLPHGDATLYIGIDPNAEVTRTLENNEMLFPVVGDSFDAIVQSGYDEFMKWEGSYKQKLYNRTPNYQALYMLWALKIVEYCWLHTWNMFLALLGGIFWVLGKFMSLLTCSGCSTSAAAAEQSGSKSPRPSPSPVETVSTM